MFSVVLGTLSVVKASINQKIKNLVLISSDKAVRPTNIMGASKRFAEICLQVYKEKNLYTSFSIVRFGNVLASSGSVIPKFKQQIIKGGPVTLTHNDVTRYFMTVSEAAQLVLQSSVLSQGGEVFLLDMGEPVRIKDLAEQMVRLSGFSQKDASNSNGDQEIVCTGLRPGKTLRRAVDRCREPAHMHPLVFRAQENISRLSRNSSCPSCIRWRLPSTGG